MTALSHEWLLFLGRMDIPNKVGMVCFSSQPNFYGSAVTRCAGTSVQSLHIHLRQSQQLRIAMTGRGAMTGVNPSSRAQRGDQDKVTLVIWLSINTCNEASLL